MITRVNDVSISKIAGATLSTVRTATICSAVAACCGEPAGPESMVILGNASSWADAPGATSSIAIRTALAARALLTRRSGVDGVRPSRLRRSRERARSRWNDARRDPMGGDSAGSAARGEDRAALRSPRPRAKSVAVGSSTSASAPRRLDRRRHGRASAASTARSRAARAGRSGSPSPRSGTARGPRARHTPIPWRRRAAGRGSRGGRRRGSRRAATARASSAAPRAPKMAGGRPRPPVSPRSIASVTVEEHADHRERARDPPDDPPHARRRGRPSRRREARAGPSPRRSAGGTAAAWARAAPVTVKVSAQASARRPRRVIAPALIGSP